jgi:hypothetical protein
MQQLRDSSLHVNQLLPLNQRKFYLLAPILVASFADQLPQIEIEVIEELG